MIDPYLDITEVSYASKKLFNLLFVRENSINPHDLDQYKINALSFVTQGLNIQENWPGEIASKIEGLRLNNYRYASLEWISQFNNLQYFQLLGEVCNGEIPFVKFEKLKEVALTYQARTCNQLFEKKNIEYLDLGYYKDRYGTGLAELKKLKTLKLNHSAFSDLSFISEMGQLKKLGVGYNYKLTQIEHIGNVKATLKSFGIQNCKKIGDWDMLQEMRGIEFIYIENCGEIDSLEFLNSLPNLRELHIIGSTKILDGKLEKIINKPSIEKAHISIHKNYDITLEDMRKFNFVPFLKIE